MGINVATFQYFKSDSNEELLSRIFLIEPSQVENNTQAKGDSKRRRFLTRQELLEIAKQNGVEDLYQRLVVELDKEFFSGRTLSSHPFLGADNGALHGVVIFSLLPPRSSREEGLHFQIYLDRFATYFKLEKERVIKLLPANKVPWSYHEGAGEYYSGFEGFFADINEVDRFLVGIKSVPQA